MKLTICHIITTFISKSGSARRTYAVCKALAKKYKVVLIVGKDYDPTGFSLEDIQIIKISELQKYLDPIKDSIAFYKLYRVIKQLSPVVVHTHLAKAGILGRLAAHLAGVQWILHTVHGPTFSNFHPTFERITFWTAEKLASLVTDYFIFVGKSLQKFYTSNNLCKPYNSLVIKTGKDISQIKKALVLPQNKISEIRKNLFQASEKELILGFVGRIVPSKNLEHLVKVAELLKEKKVSFKIVIVGKALLKEELWYERHIKKLIAKHNLNRHFVFLGFVKDIFPIFRALDLVILTSRYEGLPNVLVEAGLCERVCIAYNIGGAQEVIHDGETGFLVSYGNVYELAEKIMEFLSNRKKFYAVGQKAREILEKEYSMEKMLSDYIQYYDMLLSS